MNEALAREFIIKAKMIHGTKYSYEKVKYINQNTVILITCTRCGEHFSKLPCTHLRGAGCRPCDIASGLIKSGRAKKSLQTFLEEARKAHGDQYEYSNTVYSGALDKVIITCKAHGDFEQFPDNHLKGKGCLKCARQQSALDKVMSKEEFLKKANEVWICKYDYTKSNYTGMRNEMIVTCPLHGDFTTKARVHLAGHISCSNCQHHGYSEKAMKWLRQVAEDEDIHIQHAENGGEFAVDDTPYHADGFCAETQTLYESCIRKDIFASGMFDRSSTMPNHRFIIR